ncbi:hypothetical protein KUH03_10120 [Sphingobacterium sp. E70]|uniref:hypothetical protein n=1 Tax=Sphingobacterium sp. E70 TaxID=2853439 RepID=UPI00211CD0FE|nr:hypothetical protein [Sphingobacterium sp. E70]ULT27091.1 hypothetical protein KUH03_10120 [Sphingobacterium sp. E70]
MQLAKAAVEEVIPKYNLVNNFAEQFKSASMPTMKGNAEMIFVIRYLNGESTSFLIILFMLQVMILLGIWMITAK